MSLFQSSVLKKHLKSLDKPTIEKAYKKYVKYFHDPKIQQNIKESKEEQFQAKFLDELFVNILGYTLSPQSNYNLATEYKNESNSKKAEVLSLKSQIAQTDKRIDELVYDLYNLTSDEIELIENS